MGTLSTPLGSVVRASVERVVEEAVKVGERIERLVEEVGERHIQSSGKAEVFVARLVVLFLMILKKQTMVRLYTNGMKRFWYLLELSKNVFASQMTTSNASAS